MRTPLLFAAALSAALISASAFAHDPSLHEGPAPKRLPKATTCQQLTDSEHYSADLADPAIKTLKAKCDAAKKTAKPAPVNNR